MFFAFYDYRFYSKEHRLQANLDGLYADREIFRKLPIDPERKLPVFKITINGTKYTDRKGAAKAALRWSIRFFI